MGRRGKNRRKKTILNLKMTNRTVSLVPECQVLLSLFKIYHNPP